MDIVVLAPQQRLLPGAGAERYAAAGMGAVNGKEFANFRGTLYASGAATASLHVPANLPLGSGFTFHHACVVYDASGVFYMASHAVPLKRK